MRGPAKDVAPVSSILPTDAEAISEDEDVEEEEHEWLLGFVETPLSPESLLRHRFPSKLGGRPAWLDPLRLPSPAQLAGPDEGSPLSFLLQVYAPVDSDAAAFHRTVFVFIHTDAAQLLQPGGVRALRCQLPLVNEFYGEAPAPEEESRPRRVLQDPTHPDQWDVARAEQGDLPQSTGRSPFIFPEAELVVEEESSASDPEQQERELQRLMKRACIQNTGGGGAGDEDSEDEPGVMEGVEAQITDDQRDFAAFSARIMPQLLTHLGIDDAREDALDWAMLAVYCCSASCTPGENLASAYLDEFVWVQPPLR
ncbi:Programmed cell death protein 2 [Auxenochlorella protothecoides]|uniref:Programmed cell death protein 2 n=1 Tax=Auxenochlorella protothecoides TaxID=3075 RepID=A0A087SBV4_AUXPR|nr:Programmed cell death protein 2 [Auxenochlorella protothecoides]KFM23208.1 Programmed cell death protein 2 [Auxenochlorella protothecoides]